MPSSIEWTDETWNPTVGCSRVSPGCDHCYAISVAHRGLTEHHRGLTIRRPGERPDWTGEVRCLPDRLDVPFHWRRPRRVFVDSMSDLFHPDVPVDFITRVWHSMIRAPQHTFQILTKRPQRMAEVTSSDSFLDDVGAHPAPHIWLGTSIENDRYAFRADHLRRAHTQVRFLSLEPLLGPLPSLDLTGIDWVIAGGESGPGARPMHPDWVRDIRDRCVDADVPFFFKQWGAWHPFELDAQPPFWIGHDHELVDGHHLPADLTEDYTPVRRDGATWWCQDLLDDVIYRKGTKTFRQLDGRTWDEMPAVAS